MELIDSLRESQFVPQNHSLKIKLKKILVRFHRFSTATMYLVCVIAFFYYNLNNTDEDPVLQSEVDRFQFNDDSYSSDNSYDDPQSTFALKKPTHFEKFPYESDISVLPIAPYEGVQEQLDFKATTAVYFEHLKNYILKSTQASSQQPPIFNFHWNDFVDLKILQPLLEEKPNCFRIGALGATTRVPWPNCLDEPKNLGFVFITAFLNPETEFRSSIRGKSYLYTAAPLPNKLIFLAGDLAFVTKVGKKLRLEEGTMIDEYLQRKQELNPDKTQAELVKLPIDPLDELNEISKILNRNLINFNVDKQLEVDVDRASFRSQTNTEKSTLANAARHNNDRHFRNVIIKSKDGKWASEEQYDWRFFNKKLNNLNKMKALHNLVENYLQFSNNLGLKTWLSGEAMTSWNYNGLLGPWEETIKFELPASDITRLANSFNYSLIIADPRNGTGNYLIDVSPWFLERAIHNDGGAAPDLADARIIDTNSGIHIELYGVTNAPRINDYLVQVYNDEILANYVVTGKGNFWHLPSLLPLNRTLYEGKLSNVPKTLLDDYVEIPNEYTFKQHLRLFVEENKCTYVPEEEKGKFDQTYIGCCHDNLIWKQYNSTKFASKKFQEIRGKPVNALDETAILYG